MVHQHFERFERLGANVIQISAQLEQEGFRKEWFPAESVALERAVLDWKACGYEIRRLPLEEEQFARDIDCPPGTGRQRVPVYVRKAIS